MDLKKGRYWLNSCISGYWPLWRDIVWRILKTFLPGNLISASHSTSQLNQVFILSNSWKINVPCKDFTQCKVLLLWEFEDITNVLPMLEKYSDNFLKSNFCSCSLYYIHCFQKIWGVAVKIDHNNVFSVWSSSSWTQYVLNKVMDYLSS